MEFVLAKVFDPAKIQHLLFIFHRNDIMFLQDQRKSGKGVREAIAMANQAFHLELNVSFPDFLQALDLDRGL